jgi:hypothetical protein
MQKGIPPTVEEIEQEIRKLYPGAAETSAVSAGETPAVSHGITHQHHPNPKVNNFKKTIGARRSDRLVLTDKTTP